MSFLTFLHSHAISLTFTIDFFKKEIIYFIPCIFILNYWLFLKIQVTLINLRVFSFSVFNEFACKLVIVEISDVNQHKIDIFVNIVIEHPIVLIIIFDNIIRLIRQFFQLLLTSLVIDIFNNCPVLSLNFSKQLPINIDKN